MTEHAPTTTPPTRARYRGALGGVAEAREGIALLAEAKSLGKSDQKTICRSDQFLKERG